MISPRPRLVVREVVPGVTVSAVILADRAPLALAQVRSPEAPREFVAFLDPLMFLRVVHARGVCKMASTPQWMRRLFELSERPRVTTEIARREAIPLCLIREQCRRAPRFGFSG